MRQKWCRHKGREIGKTSLRFLTKSSSIRSHPCQSWLVLRKGEGRVVDPETAPIRCRTTLKMFVYSLFMARKRHCNPLGKRKSSEKPMINSSGTSRQAEAEIRRVHALSELQDIGFQKASIRVRCSRETAPSVKFPYFQPRAWERRKNRAWFHLELWSQRGRPPRRRSNRASRKTSIRIKAVSTA